jgi:hypothetical protein
MTRVEATHNLLCTDTIPNEKAFDNINDNDWHILHTQLKDVQTVYNDLDRVLDDFQQSMRGITM